jgi:hypothetical protein
MQLQAIVQRILGMDDAATCGHQINLSRADDLLIAQTVSMQHFAFNQPGEGLQANVRMGADMHTLAGIELHRPGMIEKAPRTNHSLLSAGQEPTNEQSITKICTTGFNSHNWGHFAFPRQASFLKFSMDTDLDEGDLDMVMDMIGSTCTVERIDADGAAWVAIWWNGGEGTLMTQTGPGPEQMEKIAR